MTPERYRQIYELFKAASGRDPKARPEGELDALRRGLGRLTVEPGRLLVAALAGERVGSVSDLVGVVEVEQTP